MDTEASQPPHVAASSSTHPLTPEQIQKIADRVYELWYQELQIQRERRRGFGFSPKQGGR